MAEGEAFGVDPLLVQHDELLGDLADGGADAALGLGEVAAAEAVQGGRLPADVLAQHVDLVGRDVQLVVALVGDEEVVALDAADGPLDHPFVAADAVLDVDDVVARLEILEEPGALAPARPRPSVGVPAPGEVALGDDGQLGRRQRDAMVQGSNDHVATGTGEVTGGAAVHRQVEAVLAQQPGEAVRRSVAVGGDDDAVPVDEQLGQPGDESGSVADDRSPPRRLHDRRLRGLRRRVQRPRRIAPAEQAIGTGVQAREGLVGLALPRRRQRRGQVVLLGQEVDRPVTHPARLDEQHLGAGRQHVREQLLGVHEPGQPALHAVEQGPFGEALPLLTAPRLGPDELGGPRPHVVGGDQLAGREDQRLGEIVDGALVVDAEAGQAIDLVTPQVDAYGGVAGRGEDVDDRPAAGELAAMLDELLAAVPEGDEPCDELVGVDDVGGVDGDRVRGRGFRPETLQQAADASDDDGRPAIGVAQAPQQLEPLAHRLDRRADPLERQGLPRREDGDLAGGQELLEVVGELGGHRRRRRGDDQRTASGQRCQRGDGDRPSDLDHRQPGVGLPEGARQGRFVAQ